MKETTLKDVYGTNNPTIPAGYDVIGFRLPKAGEICLSAPLMEAVRVTRPSEWGERLILQSTSPPPPSPPKMIRVIRLLEYYGTEDWVDATMRNNAVKSYGQVFPLSGRDYIKEVWCSRKEKP